MFDNIKKHLAVTIKELRMPIRTASAAGAATQNSICGRVKVAASATSVVVTNANVTANTLVFTSIIDADAGNATVLSAVAGAGSFTITMSGAVTADQEIAYMLVNPAVTS
jgi:hypothetical protein